MIIRPVKTQICTVKDQCNREIIQKVVHLLHKEKQKKPVHTRHTCTFYLATPKLQRYLHFTLGKKNTYRNILLDLFFFAPRMGIKYDINYKYTFKIEKLQLLIIFVSVQLQD